MDLCLPQELVSTKGSVYPQNSAKCVIRVHQSWRWGGSRCEGPRSEEAAASWAVAAEGRLALLCTAQSGWVVFVAGLVSRKPPLRGQSVRRAGSVPPDTGPAAATRTGTTWYLPRAPQNYTQRHQTSSIIPKWAVSSSGSITTVITRKGAMGGWGGRKGQQHPPLGVHRPLKRCRRDRGLRGSPGSEQTGWMCPPCKAGLILKQW